MGLGEGHVQHSSLIYRVSMLDSYQHLSAQVEVDGPFLEINCLMFEFSQLVEDGRKGYFHLTQSEGTEPALSSKIGVQDSSVIALKLIPL